MLLQIIGNIKLRAARRALGVPDHVTDIFGKVAFSPNPKSNIFKWNYICRPNLFQVVPIARVIVESDVASVRFINFY